MTEIELPDWAKNLAKHDQDHFREQLRVATNEKWGEIIEDYLDLVTDPGYQMVRDVLYNRSRTNLPTKTIVLPKIPCDDDSIRESWAQDEGKQDGTWGELVADVQKIHNEEWERIVREFERNPLDMYNAFQFLDHHPAFWQFHHDDGETPPSERIHHRNLLHNFGIQRAVTIDASKVNPLTGRVDDDDSLNTHTEVWVEMGRWEWPTTKPVDEHSRRDAHFHDTDLDCGSHRGSIDEAIVIAAIVLHTRYGNDRRVCDAPSEWSDPEQIAELAAWYDTHDVFGNLLPKDQWAHGSVPPEAGNQTEEKA